MIILLSLIVSVGEGSKRDSDRQFWFQVTPMSDISGAAIAQSEEAWAGSMLYTCIISVNLLRNTLGYIVSVNTIV